MIKETVVSYKKRVVGLSVAYARVFDNRSPFTEQVLRDLAIFCRAHVSTFHPDSRVHAILEGRREVWLKIQEMLQMTPDEIYQLHRIRETRPREENE